MQSLALTQTDMLPETSGVYIVYLDDVVLYVGKAKNIKSRWIQHHRTKQLLRDYPECLISWVEFPFELLDGNESAMIEALNPVLNGTKVDYQSLSKRFTVVVSDANYERLERLSKQEGKKPATQAAFMLETQLVNLDNEGKIQKSERKEGSSNGE